MVRVTFIAPDGTTVEDSVTVAREQPPVITITTFVIVRAQYSYISFRMALGKMAPQLLLLQWTPSNLDLSKCPD